MAVCFLIYFRQYRLFDEKQARERNYDERKLC